MNGTALGGNEPHQPTNIDMKSIVYIIDSDPGI